MRDYISIVLSALKNYSYVSLGTIKMSRESDMVNVIFSLYALIAVNFNAVHVAN